ncbi:SH2 domain-containing protein [Aphelenchoides fujianensis]|nr:SH2 domain-containing protein [Aphelenchoides fujianensis]
MEEAQYDIPWELKARNFAALRSRPHSANEAGGSTGGLVRISPSMAASGPAVHPPHSSASPSTSASTPSPSGGDPQPHQRVRSAVLPSSQLVFRPTANYPRVAVDPKHAAEHAAVESQAAFWGAAPFGGPPVPAPRQHVPQKSANQRDLHNYQNHYPLVQPAMVSTGTGTSTGEPLDTPLPHRRHRVHFDEQAMVHEQMDRVEAEKRLEPRPVGDYLLRRRADGSLAMSLRTTDVVLHIKLERRESSFVLGEGPSFRTIGSILRFYARTELPIKRAEHVRLREAVLVDGH